MVQCPPVEVASLAHRVARHWNRELHALRVGVWENSLQRLGCGLCLWPAAVEAILELEEGLPDRVRERDPARVHEGNLSAAPALERERERERGRGRSLHQLFRLHSSRWQGSELTWRILATAQPRVPAPRRRHLAPAISSVLRPGRALHFILFRVQVHLLLPNKSFPAIFLVGGGLRSQNQERAQNLEAPPPRARAGRGTRTPGRRRGSQQPWVSVRDVMPRARSENSAPPARVGAPLSPPAPRPRQFSLSVASWTTSDLG